MLNFQNKHLGSFRDEVEAAKAYDAAITESNLIERSTTMLNFPEDNPQYATTSVVHVPSAPTSRYRGVTKNGSLKSV